MNWSIEKIIGVTARWQILAALVYGALCGAILMGEFGWPGLAAGFVAPFVLYAMIVLFNLWDWFPLPFLIFILASMILPAYRDHAIKTAVADQVVAPLRPVLAAVEKHAATSRTYPGRWEDLGMVSPATGALSRVRFDAATGRVSAVLDTVVLARGAGWLVVASEDRGPHTLVFTPARDAAGKFTWTCASPDMKKAQLPKAC